MEWVAGHVADGTGPAGAPAGTVAQGTRTRASVLGLTLLVCALTVNLAVSGALVLSLRGYEATQQHAATVRKDSEEVEARHEVLVARLHAKNAELDTVASRLQEARSLAAGAEARHAAARQAMEAEAAARANAVGLAAKASQAQSMIDGLEKQLTDIAARRESADKQVAATRSEADELREQRGALKPEVDSLLADAKRLSTTKNDLAEAHVELQQLRLEIGAAQFEVSSLQQQRDKLQRQVGDLQANTQAVQVELDRLNQQKELLTIRLAGLVEKQKGAQQLTDQLGETKGALSEARGRLRETQSALADLQSQQGRLKGEIDNLTAAQIKAAKELGGAEAREKIALQVSQQVEARKARLAELDVQERDLRATIKAALGRLEVLQGTEGDLRQKIGVLTETLRQRSAEIGGPLSPTPARPSEGTPKQ